MSNSYYAYNNLGVALLQQGEHDAALVCFHRALRSVRNYIERSRTLHIHARGTTGSTMKVGCLIATCRKQFQATEDTTDYKIFVLYDKAFLIYAKTEMNSATPLFLGRYDTLKNREKVVACTMFNIALTYHRRALLQTDQVSKRLINKAESMYCTLLQLIMQDEDYHDKESPYCLLLCATWNNLGEICAQRDDQKEIIACHYRLSKAFQHACSVQKLAAEDKLLFFCSILFYGIYHTKLHH